MVQCEKCHLEFATDLKTCSHCGEATTALTVAPKVSGATFQSSIHGIGGWLVLLIGGMMIFGPLFQLGNISNEFRDALEKYPQLAGNSQWQNYKQVSWIIFMASASISFAAGYRLWKIHRPESVRFAIIANWLVGPLQNALYIVFAAIIFGTRSGGDAIAQMITSVIISCISAGIWTAYLIRSVRVKNTYQLPH